jgi:uncharacterized membrane protein YgdD (TMEM256/DUF423 family)
MKTWMFLAAVNGALALLAGAFAAHGLKARLSPELLGVFDTGARYHMSHALAMGLAALAARAGVARARLAAALFQTGILLFSGSLYLLALTAQTALGFVTPFGGVILLAGWLVLAWGALKT